MDHHSPPTSSGLLGIINDAIKAVPAVRYALAVAGIGASVALVAGFTIDLRIAVFGIIVLFLFMAVMVVFARLASVAAGALYVLAMVLAWAAVILVIATSVLLLTSIFFKKPLDLHRWIVDEGPVIIPTPTPTPTPTPIPTPSDSATINLLEGRLLEGAIKDMARLDNSRAIIRNCSNTFMKSKIRGGVVRAKDIRGLIEILQYRIDDPKTNEKYTVIRKEQEQTYEIACGSK